MRPHRAALALLALGAFAAAVVPPRIGAAQTTGGPRVYVVGAGDSISTIAEHLGVPTRALVERNHLQAPYTLRVGRRLRLPEGVSSEVMRSLPLRDAPAGAVETPAPREREHDGAGHHHAGATPSFGRPRRPGLVRLIRESTEETLALNLRRPNRISLRRMMRFLRSNEGAQHPIDGRLMRQLALVSDHFGGRVVHVISGFRPFRHGQYTPHSNHNIGHAIDFRVEGVSNRVLRDFCRTLPNTGCGYYPRSVFVHMDVREQSTTWVDWSRPGQRPIYGREDRPPEMVAHAGAQHPTEAPAQGDEDMDDVAADDTHIRTAAPSENEGAEPAGGGEQHAAAASPPSTGASAPATPAPSTPQ
jgi:uncharacterized protein YcbK (DUF882 family)